jgi:hypothetical protein
MSSRNILLKYILKFTSVVCESLLREKKTRGMNLLQIVTTTTGTIIRHSVAIFSPWTPGFSPRVGSAVWGFRWTRWYWDSFRTVSTSGCTFHDNLSANHIRVHSSTIKAVESYSLLPADADIAANLLLDNWANSITVIIKHCYSLRRRSGNSVAYEIWYEFF